MEKLLNKLIEKGWKPFGRNSNKAYYKPEGPDEFYFGENGYGYIYNRRQLVSKESGLWQFVCKNKLYSRQVYVWLTNIEGFNDEFGDNDYQFRLIESALKDESELEQFLLDNIKI